MAFVAIDTSKITIGNVADQFKKSRDKLKKRESSLEVFEYRKSFAKFTTSAIDALGGDGDLAVEMVHLWETRPYLSRMRWAVTAASGQNVAQELAKVQDRAWRYFVMNHTAYGYDMSAVEQRPRTYPQWQKAISALSPKDLRFYNRLNNTRVDFAEMKKFADLASSKKSIRTIQAMAALSGALAQPMTLFRGVCCEQGYQIHQSLKTHQTVTIAADHAVSFTGNQSTADYFAVHGIKDIKFKHHRPIVLKIDPPQQSLIAVPELFWRLEGEDEYIVSTDGSFEVHGDDVETVNA